MKKRNLLVDKSLTDATPSSKTKCSTPKSRVRSNLQQSNSSENQTSVPVKSIFGRVFTDITNLTPVVLEESLCPRGKNLSVTDTGKSLY